MTRLSESGPMPPEEQARCYCGVKTEWIWDREFEEWAELLCWRCMEIKRMKNEQIANEQGYLADWKMNPKTAQRFIDMILKKGFQCTSHSYK